MDDVKKDSKRYGGTSDANYFKFEDKGLYRMRILTKPTVIATHFFGKGQPSHVCVGIDEGCKFHSESDKKPSIKLATYVIDRGDENRIKMAELPLSISYGINDMQEDEDFAFSEFPMPYDVKVMYDPDNDDPKMKYRVQPSPKREELTAEQSKALEEKMSRMTPEQYVEKKKQREKDKIDGVSSSKVEYTKDDINPDDIPF